MEKKYLKPSIGMIDAMSEIILNFGSVYDEVGDGYQLSKEIDFYLYEYEEEEEKKEKKLYENVWE